MNDESSCTHRVIAAGQTVPLLPKPLWAFERLNEHLLHSFSTFYYYHRNLQRLVKSGHLTLYGVQRLHTR